MRERADPALVAFCGSEARALTLGVLANAVSPMTGYRVAKVAGVPESKVYPELRRAVSAGIVRKEKDGYRLVDGDLRALLQKRVRLFWDVDWDRARDGWDGETSQLLEQGMSAIRRRLRNNSAFLRPDGWRPPAAARAWDQELRRPADKDARLRRRGYRTSKREDWAP
jgi:hypothetical protein